MNKYFMSILVLALIVHSIASQETSVPNSFSAGDVIVASDINENNEYLSSEIEGLKDQLKDLQGNIQIPIGGIIPWAKSLTNTPALLSNYAECNGQVLNDPESPYDQTILPDLNGKSSGIKRFLRGSTTSGTVGGEDFHTLTVNEMPSHNHGLRSDQYDTTPTDGSYTASNQHNDRTNYTNSTGGGAAHENRPPFYEVVFIIRIK